MNSLVREITKGLLEDSKRTIGVFGGGFKPPTKGHMQVIKQAIDENPEMDEVIIYVGKGERDGVTQEDSVKVWNIYQRYLPFSVKVIPSTKPPIQAIYNLAKENPEDEVLWIIGARDGSEDDFTDIAQRTKSMSKYPNLELRTIVTTGGISGTAARGALRTSKEKFDQYLPDYLTVDEKGEIYTILTNKVSEKQTLNEEASFSQYIDYKAKIDELTQHMLRKGMNITPLPKVIYAHDDEENAKDFFGKTAYYDPENLEIVLYTEGRHPKDIVRSFAHEMIHHIQNMEGRLGNVVTTNTNEDDHLEKLEQEANLRGTMTFRNWTDSVKNKDPFGLNAFARQLGNLSEIGDASAGVFPYNKNRIDTIVDTLKTKIDIQPDAKWQQHLLPFLKFSSPNAEYNVITTAQVNKPLILPDFQADPVTIDLRVDFMVNESDEATNIGEQYKVMATMTQIIKELIAEINKLEGPRLDSVKIFPKSDNGNEESNVDSKRGRLYKAYVEKNLPQGWQVSVSKDARGSFIALYPSLKEIGDASSKSFDWKEDSDSMADYGVTFTTDLDTKYDVDIDVYDNVNFDSDKTYKMLDIAFNVHAQSSTQVTNKGEMFPVMATIVDITKHYLKKLGANGIVYNPSKKSKEGNTDNQRDRLYRAFIQKAFPNAKIKVDGTAIVVLLDTKPLKEEEGKYKIYVDMDGVVADFDKRFRDISGMAPKEFENKYGKKAFWDLIDEENKIKFWVGIPPMPGASELISFVSKHDYEMLTAPSIKKQSRLGKNLWIRNHTGDIFPSKPKVNFRFAKEKHLIKPQLTNFDILIDDRAATIDNWNAAGGTGILYKSAPQVISKLKELGL